MSNATKQKVVSGHLVQIVMRGQVIANCQTTNSNVDLGAQPIFGLGDLEPNEIVNTRYQGSFTVNRFFMRAKNLAALGLAGLSPADILTMEPFNVQVLDKATGRTIRVYEECTPASYGDSFTANAVGGENLTVMYKRARRAGDETGTKLGNIGEATQGVVGAIQAL